ncbi:unnamed protein product [Nezara viridula]|uniref:PHD-type domain-containing protein n=1 Tax=Nezara viridula TaxID=85310 RepID=A0A9P0ECV6_NEZVI|nr:unnamed protein product [Nezara viridula]
MVNCKLCSKTISREDKTKIVCVTCQNLFHVKCTKIGSTDLEGLKETSKKWKCSDCELLSGTLPAAESSSTLDLLRGLTEEVRELKSKLQGIDELKEIKEALQKQSELSFENMDRLLKIETLLEDQKTHVENLTIENNKLKTKISELEIRLNFTEQNLLDRR